MHSRPFVQKYAASEKSCSSPFQPRLFSNEDEAETQTAAPQQETPSLQTRLEHDQPHGFSFSQIPVFPPVSRGIQAKLTVGEPNDQYEQEADRVAEQVMSMAPPATPNIQRQTEEEESEEIRAKPLAETVTPIIQRQEALEDGEPIQAKWEACEQKKQVQRSADGAVQAQPNLEQRLNASEGGGKPLSEEVRSFMEPRFGADFSQVRVHTDSSAVQMNRELNAQAFAHGQNIYFSAGKTPGNDALTAHELTHVVQQQGSEIKSNLDAKPASQKITEPESDLLSESYGPEITQNDGFAKTNVVLLASPMIQCIGVDSVAQSVAKRALKWLAKKGANISAHVAKRHITKRLGKSTFTHGGKFVKKLVSEAIEHSDNIVNQGRRLVFEKQFGHSVGQAGEKIVRVVVDKATGKIVTAFPTQTFKTIVAVAVGAVASGKASEADAAILKRREAIAKALEPGLLESIIDFFVAPSSVARDEDIIAEERIIERTIQEAINATEEEMQRSLSIEERDEVREIVLTEMQTEASAGGNEE